MVMRPDSSGSRSTSSTRRSNSGSSSRNSTPLWASEISPGRGGLPPPTGPRRWRCGAGAKRAPTPVLDVESAAGQQRTAAVSRASASDIAGGSRQALRHALARAWRADQQQAVLSGGRDLQRTPRARLAADVGKIRCSTGCAALGRFADRRQGLHAARVSTDLDQVGGAEDARVAGQRRFGEIGSRKDQRVSSTHALQRGR
jgi:hypothetical protein